MYLFFVTNNYSQYVHLAICPIYTLQVIYIWCLMCNVCHCVCNTDYVRNQLMVVSFKHYLYSVSGLAKRQILIVMHCLYIYFIYNSCTIFQIYTWCDTYIIYSSNQMLRSNMPCLCKLKFDFILMQLVLLYMWFYKYKYNMWNTNFITYNQITYQIQIL